MSCCRRRSKAKSIFKVAVLVAPLALVPDLSLLADDGEPSSETAEVLGLLEGLHRAVEKLHRDIEALLTEDERPVSEADEILRRVGELRGDVRRVHRLLEEQVAGRQPAGEEELAVEVAELRREIRRLDQRLDGPPGDGVGEDEITAEEEAAAERAAEEEAAAERAAEEAAAERVAEEEAAAERAAEEEAAAARAAEEAAAERAAEEAAAETVPALEQLMRPERTYTWANVGIGLGGPVGDNWGGIAAAATISHQRGVHVFSLRASGLGELRLMSRGRDIFDAGVLYGAGVRRRFGYASAAAGLGWVQKVARDGETQNSVGVPLEAQAFFTPVEYIGAGVQLLGNINPVQPSFGILAALQLTVPIPLRP